MPISTGEGISHIFRGDEAASQADVNEGGEFLFTEAGANLTTESAINLEDEGKV